MSHGSDPTFMENADAFSAMLTQFVKMKEGYPHNHAYQWSMRDVAYIHAALAEMTAEQRTAFREHFKDYQIAKILTVPPQGSS